MLYGGTAHPTDRDIGRAISLLRIAGDVELDDISDGIGLDAQTLLLVESGERALLARELVWLLQILGALLSLNSSLKENSASKN